VRLYKVFCATVLAGFAWMEWRGIDLIPESQRTNLPASVRGAPGATRVFRTGGGGGFRGGK